MVHAANLQLFIDIGSGAEAAAWPRFLLSMVPRIGGPIATRGRVLF